MMKLLRFLLFSLIVSTSYSHLFAQELNCAVQVVTPQIQGSDKEIYNTMQKAIYEFINNRKWTNHTYDNQERIECSILINIQERISTEEFKGTIQVQSRRPVHGSSYTTTMLNLKDNNMQFTYNEGNAINWAENSHIDNLSSVLAFYVYVILGVDYDSFSLNGGNPYFEKALNVVNNAQSAKEKGWKSFESQKNRYWLIENLTNANYSAIHTFMYKYHRIGLDNLQEKGSEARTSIKQSIDELLKLKRNYPNIYFFQPLFTAKSDELVNIFKSKNFTGDKAAVAKSLTEIDPGNAGKYKNIIGN